MATADSVKAKIQGLIDQSNAATGNTDADLTTAVGALIAGFGQGGGGVTVESANVYEITIGANSITNAFDANAYIFSLVKAPAYVLLKSKPDTNNQLVGFGCRSGLDITRYRNGALSLALNQAAYDGVLVEGTVYTVFEYGV